MNDITEPIIVAYITDDNFSMPTVVSITSLFANATKDTRIIVYVFCDAISEGSRRRLMSLGADGNKKVILIDVLHDKYANFSDRAKLCINHVSHAAVYKFDLPQLIEEKKVIYIDGDTVINGDIKELWSLEMDGKSILAVDDLLDEHKEGLSEMAKGIGSEVSHYYNSGVMILDLDRLKRINATECLIEYRLNGTNRYMDQDAFNGALYKEIKPISPRYNFMMQVTDFEDIDGIDNRCNQNWRSIEECINDALIIHFAGPIKPWKYNRPWFTDIFLKYYEEAGYSTKDLKLLSPLKRLNDDKNWLKGQIKAEKSKGYVFPYNKVTRGSKVVLWGTGNVGKSYKQQIDATSYCRIARWVDSNDPKAESPETILQTDCDYIIVATVNPVYIKQIVKMLTEQYRCEKSKIITVY